MAKKMLWDEIITALAGVTSILRYDPHFLGAAVHVHSMVRKLLN